MCIFVASAGLLVTLPALLFAQQDALRQGAPGARDDRARTEALAKRAANRMETLHREADRLAAQERTLLGDLRKLEVARQIKIEELRLLDSEAAAIERELAGINERVTKLNADQRVTRPELEARLVEIYKLGQPRYARLVLSTPDARTLGQAVRIAAALAKLDRDRVAAHENTLAELRTARATLETRARRLAALRAEVRQTEAEAVRAAQARSAAIQDIDRQRDLNAQLAGELQAAQQKLQTSLRALTGGLPAAAPAVTGLPVKAFQGDLAWPVAGTIRRRFAPPASGAPTASNGIEIVALEGLAVSAVHEGVVAYAEPFSGYGNLVIVDHGAQAFSLYGHLLEIDVKKGDVVEAGHPVGAVGASPTGLVGLYFELRVDGQAVDPLQWLRKK